MKVKRAEVKIGRDGELCAVIAVECDSNCMSAGAKNGISYVIFVGE